MKNYFRKSPPVCLFISIIRLISGKLKLSKKYQGKIVKMDDGNGYKTFRNITIYPDDNDSNNCVFIVSFKFSKLSHKGNKLASIIPMLLITGFPGFVKKIYAVNHENGYWQGMYQWESLKHLEAYKKSFVFRVMNKRAIQGSINSFEIENENLFNFIERSIVN